MGVFSKIGKVFKKVVRKIGGVIKKVTKPLRKALKAVMKPFGKVFGKLGWVGTIALGLMFPGFGNIMGSWMQGLTNFVMKPFQMLGNTIAPRMTNFLGNVLNGIKTGGKKIFSSITETFKHGINKMGQAFGYADPGKLSWVEGEGLISGASISGAPTGTLTDSITKGLSNLRDRTFGKTQENVIDMEIDMEKISDIKPDYRTAGASLEGPQIEVEAFDNIQPIKVTAEYRRPPGLENLTDSAWEEYKKTDAWTDFLKEGQAANLATQRGPFEKGLDWFEEKLADAKESPTGRGLTLAATGLDAYNKYLAEDPEDPFYNPMSSYANSMLTDVQQPGLDGLMFTEQQPVSSGFSPNQLAEMYLTGSGQVMPSGQYDSFNFAMQQPGYGYMFNDYLADYYGNS